MPTENYAYGEDHLIRLRPLLKRFDLSSMAVRDMFEQDQRGKKVRQSYTAWLEVWLNDLKEEEK